jgi:hypothetical protein
MHYAVYANAWGNASPFQGKSLPLIIVSSRSDGFVSSWKPLVVLMLSDSEKN